LYYKINPEANWNEGWLDRSGKIRARRAFEFEQQRQGFLLALAARFFAGAEPAAYHGPFRLAIELAAIIGCELHAADARRFPLWHSGNGRRNR
jgi:hypothetical protein